MLFERRSLRRWPPTLQAASSRGCQTGSHHSESRQDWQSAMVGYRLKMEKCYRLEHRSVRCQAGSSVIRQSQSRISP